MFSFRLFFMLCCFFTVSPFQHSARTALAESVLHHPDISNVVRRQNESVGMGACVAQRSYWNVTRALPWKAARNRVDVVRLAVLGGHERPVERGADPERLKNSCAW